MLAPWHFIVVALATWQTVDVFQHSEYFAGMRATAEETTTSRFPVGWFSRLFLCGWCSSIWVAAFWVGIFMLPASDVWLIQILGYALAASRLANWAHDHFHDEETWQREMLAASEPPGSRVTSEDIQTPEMRIAAEAAKQDEENRKMADEHVAEYARSAEEADNERQAEEAYDELERRRGRDGTGRS